MGGQGSTFVGSDDHAPSVDAARTAAADAGVADRGTFEVASAQTVTGGTFGLACLFDCPHDMSDPVGRFLYAASATICTPNAVARKRRGCAQGGCPGHNVRSRRCQTDVATLV